MTCNRSCLRSSLRGIIYIYSVSRLLISATSVHSSATIINTMAPHHHLRATFLTNPGLFSFPPAAAPVVASARTATVREPTSSRISPRPLAHPRRTSALSTCATTDTTGSSVLHPIVQRIAEPIKANVTEPFWRGLKDGTIEARNRERTQSEAKGLKTSEKKRALVFAGLVGRVTAFPMSNSSPCR